MVTVEIPGRRALCLEHLALDLNGTLAAGGKLLPGVSRRVAALARRLEVTVLTADTFGSSLPVVRSRIPA